MVFEKRNRDKLYIIAEILEIANEGTLKTPIMYRANLSFTQLNEYLDFMLKTDLLQKVHTNEREVYRATDKGLDFLQRYREIMGLLRLVKPVSEEASMSVQVRTTKVA
jgi:predicted transcriptional regulator